MGDVKLLSRWDGWCDPCGVERPLLLTAKGEFGPRAWLSGVGMEDRTLVLTCGVCGEWQLCPWDEEFPKESVLVVEAGPEAAQETASEVVTKRRLLGRSTPVAPTVEEAVEAAVALPVEETVRTPKARRFGRRGEDAPEVADVELLAEVADIADTDADVARPVKRVRVEAELPEITDAELLRAIARSAERTQRVLAAQAAAALAAAEAAVEAAVQAETAPVAMVEDPPVTRRFRAEAEIPEIRDAELLRAIARGAERAQRVLAAQAAAAPVTEAPKAPEAPEAPEATQTPAAPRPKRRTAPVQHIVLQTAYGPAAAAAVPSLPAPRSATPTEQDDKLRLLAEGLDLVPAAGR